MLGLFVLIAISFGVWWACQPTRRFQQGFARLIEAPQTHYGFEHFRLVNWVGGRFRNRAVTLQLLHPVEYQWGHVLLTMETHAPDGSPWKDSTLTADDPDLSRATFDLEGRYSLILTLKDGVLHATWTPPPGTFFPGAFDDRRWRTTLEQMHVLAQWLEARA